MRIYFYFKTKAKGINFKGFKDLKKKSVFGSYFLKNLFCRLYLFAILATVVT